MASKPHAEATRAPGGMTHGFRALRVRNYRLFWIGQLISLIGTWMQGTAQAWLVLKLTNSPLALGVVTTFQTLPIMALSLFGGAIADRMPKYRLVLGTQLVALFQAAVFGLLVATDHIRLPYIYGLALLLGVINAIDTPTRQSFVSELVGREDLPSAVALNSVLFNSARIVGPVIAGVLIARLGIAPAFYINAASFLGVISGLLLMDRTAFRAAPPKTSDSILRGVKEGLAYAWRTPAVLLVLVVVACIGTFGYNFNVVLPLLAGFVLHTDATGFGLLSACLGAGSLLGALTTAYTRQVTMRRLLVGSGAFSLIFIAVAVSPSFALSTALLVGLGFAGITFATTANTLLQLTVPDALRGRVMSLYILLFAGSTPIGGMLIGTLSTTIGVSPTLALCGGLCLLGVLAVVLYRRRLAASAG
ncbi:MAG TPA: MFS transporter [Herpetosiphonaceae bacterium]|nr:MFS transporter [Herpetosiphonaceae bacterium]